ncbi:PilT protein domain protein [Dethiosulfovibrio peptidovorans DSM 11002]|uniref:PilT protein domain protein n=1 Tax=Dethiosulfovibrio peptidovorans DSM 11002 TaxID=469381 RepID=D2Z3R7_9BACT|nr:type II toxin-antitoxin system VapC family toxin [Dethiosulfovibrio peptidovorans]EFC90373.1 PilT protein domain protein [Dethiosulfovibrio peptidovorans DSM 11002]
MVDYVLDACSLIAFFRGERGSDRVAEILTNNDCVIHAVNWCEVLYDLMKSREGESKVKEFSADLRKCGVTIYEAVDGDMCKDVARLKAKFFERKESLAFADCFALALSKKLNAPLVTSDKEMISVWDEYEIRFFRPPKLWFKPHHMINGAMNGKIEIDEYSSESEIVPTVNRLIQETAWLLKASFLDRRRFEAGFSAVLEDSFDDGRSKTLSLNMGAELTELYRPSLLVEALLVGVLAGAGYGPDLD